VFEKRVAAHKIPHLMRLSPIERKFKIILSELEELIEKKRM